MKHNGADHLNETWVKLLKDLKFFEDIKDHNQFLRTRWALGAAEWLAGEHNSKQNDKEILGYSDEDWNFIWSTMLEDGAWAVPSIKDSSGFTLKSNDAPEMFLKYIAHDLQCHIIIIDLQLGQVQFCSANHLKDNNVTFHSPLLLYCTGGHFQAVFQNDHEYFIKYAKELEKRNNEVLTNMDTNASSMEKAENSYPNGKLIGKKEQENRSSNSMEDVSDEKVLDYSRGLGGKNRSFDQDREYKKLMERKRLKLKRMAKSSIEIEKENHAIAEKRRKERENMTEQKKAEVKKKKNTARQNLRKEQTEETKEKERNSQNISKQQLRDNQTEKEKADMKKMKNTARQKLRKDQTEETKEKEFTEYF